MGTVYLARDRELDRDVALKVIRPHLAEDSRILKRFKREIQLSSKITHRNVLRVHDLGQEDRSPGHSGQDHRNGRWTRAWA